jgi:acetyl-CoA carboxylase biotin carboxyl carrier protein
MNMDIKEVKKWVALMHETGLTEIEVEESGRRLRLRREALTVEATGALPRPIGSLPRPVDLATPTQINPTSEGHYITSLIVGRFYRAPSPDIAPYVEVGVQVKKGQTLCIVEAMKLMNEIESDIDGRIAEICLEDGAAVEYGTHLFRIGPP